MRISFNNWVKVLPVFDLKYREKAVSLMLAISAPFFKDISVAKWFKR
jgi:hypothetical protein